MNIATKSKLTICYYPVFQDSKTLNDHIARAAWYLSCLEPEQIIFVVMKGVFPDYQVLPHLNPAISKFIKSIKDKITLIHVDDQYGDFESHIAVVNVDIIMLWDNDIIEDSILNKKLNRYRKKRRIWKVDNRKVRFEGSHYIKAGIESYHEKDQIINKNKQKLIRNIEKLKHYKKSYVFGTGPSVSTYKKFDYSDGLSIICNSIIFDNEMMKYVNPKIICFGDPIFHFGPSLYAAEFHLKLKEIVEKYDVLIVIPFNYYRIFSFNFPEFKEITIAVPFDYEKPINFNLLDEFYLNPYGNILTMLMLPIAATITYDINILGVDGRKDSDDKYFWSHNKKTQINNQMGNIQAAHPSFFNIDYNEYYENHKKSTEEYFLAGENIGKKYTVLTPSYIPSMRKRYKGQTNNSDKLNLKVAVFDPGFSNIGHSIYFNTYVLTLMSKIFSEVIYFEFDNTLQNNFKEKPENVKIVQLNNSLKVDNELNKLIKSNDGNEINVVYDRMMKRNKNKLLQFEDKKKLVHDFEKIKYDEIWTFIESFKSDLLLFTSEGILGSKTSNSIFSSVPQIPFIVIIHICWKILERETDDDFKKALNKADCLFVLEDYLKPVLQGFNDQIYQFPYSMFRDEYKLPSKNISKTLKIGTIGIINDRRNVHFILNALENYDGDNIEYFLFGKPLGKYGSLVKEMAEHFPKKTNIQLFSKFEYLSDDEYYKIALDCDFILIAYDESRKYQAPGVIYQFTQSGTPLIVPRVNPFIQIEKKYPNIFNFYDALSMESLNSTLSMLAKKDTHYAEIKEKTNKAMIKYIFDNSEYVQFRKMKQLFVNYYSGKQSHIDSKSERIDIVTEFITKICDEDIRIKKIFNKEAINKILSNDSIVLKICEEKFIKNGSLDIIKQISKEKIIPQICNNSKLYKKLCKIDIIKYIAEKRDLITEICTEDEIKGFLGCTYNARSRTDKYYGFFGKLIAAYQIYKAVNEWDKIDKPKLQALKNIHQGKRAFIICNGPSLNKIDFSKFENEITIGTNGLYLNFEETKFKPTYYVIEDDLVGEDRSEDINNIKGPVKLFAQRLSYCLARREGVVYLKHCPDYAPWRLEQKHLNMDMRFSPDISVASYGGNTVTYTCLQIAYHLGIRELYIIGADHNYEVPDRYDGKDVDENYVIEAQEDDVNHFNKDYFGKGYRWHNPKVHKIELSYQNAKKFYHYNNGMVFNATIGGFLEVFDRVNYFDLFKKGYINNKFESFLEDKKKEQLDVNNYQGSWVSFNGNFEINKKFKKIKKSWEVELILNSECYHHDYSFYDKTSPPTPIFINPIIVFQIAKTVYRIKMENFDCYVVIRASIWNKISIKYNKKLSRIQFFLNDHLVESVTGARIKLKGSCKIGNGAFNRYWKGKIGFVNIFSYSNSNEKKIVFQIDKKYITDNKNSIPLKNEKPKLQSKQPQLNSKSSIQNMKNHLSVPTRKYKEINNCNINCESLFIVGNGPSLSNFDFHRLSSTIWIGMNAAYRYWEQIDIYPDYYICLDTVVIKSHKEKIYELIQKRKTFGIKLFFLRKKLLKFYPELASTPEVVFLEDYYKSPYFEGFEQGITTGSFSVLLGAMLGYKQFYLLGIDLNYVQQIKEADTIGGYVLEINETPKNNPNYFFDDYQRKGDRYNIPDSSMPNLHYKSWIKVKERLEQFGVHVFNCNYKSQVDIFNYANIDEILAK